MLSETVWFCDASDKLLSLVRLCSICLVRQKHMDETTCRTDVVVLDHCYSDDLVKWSAEPGEQSASRDVPIAPSMERITIPAELPQRVARGLSRPSPRAAVIEPIHPPAESALQS